MADLRLSSVLTSAAESAAEALAQLKRSEVPVELEEFEIALDFEGQVDFDEIEKIQKEIERPRERQMRFPGLRVAELRSLNEERPVVSTRVRRSFWSLLRRPTPARDATPKPEDGKMRLSIRLVLSPRES